MTPIRLLLAVFAAALCCAASVLAIAERPAAGADAWPPIATAGPFLDQQLENVAEGRLAEAWAMLYPAHRQFVTEASYVACERSIRLPAPVIATTVVRVRRALVAIAGVPEPVRGVAVTERIRFADATTLTRVFHVVPVAGHWTWLMSRQLYRQFSTGACGAGPAV